VSGLTATIAFIYDFLADDGWELLVGLPIVLPLTFVASGYSGVVAGLLLVVGVLLTMSISLARRLPKSASRPLRFLLSRSFGNVGRTIGNRRKRREFDE